MYISKKKCCNTLLKKICIFRPFLHPFVFLRTHIFGVICLRFNETFFTTSGRSCIIRTRVRINRSATDLTKSNTCPIKTHLFVFFLSRSYFVLLYFIIIFKHCYSNQKFNLLNHHYCCVTNHLTGPFT